MNKELAEILLAKVIGLPFIDRAAGLVKTIETKSKDESGKVLRFPAAMKAEDSINYQDLTPNSQKKSVLYFEDYGTKITGKKAAGYTFESTLRLVCWLNAFKSGADLFAIGSILERFGGGLENAGLFTRLQIEPTEVLGLEDRIFGRYTYEETTLQYLMMPYSAFAITFKITYTLNNNCALWRQFNDSFDESFA